jgi:uncharacterized protein (DUF2336 family)
MTDILTPVLTPKIGKARDALFRRLLDVVSMPSNRLPHQDRHMVSDILLDMLFHADENARKMCAMRLSESREPPRRLLRYLGQCAIEIARPLLENSPAYDACDLRELAECTTPEHRLVIAQRKTVPATVSEWLAEHAEPHIVKALIENDGAVLPEQAVDLIVARSREEENFCGPMVERLELKPSQAMAMFWWSDGAARRKILQRHSADRLEVIEMCSDVFEMAADEDWADPVTRKALQLIERRQRNRAAIERSPFDSLEGAINASAIEGMSSFMAQEIGYLAGVKPVTIAKLMSDKGGEGLAVLCKATGLHRDFLKVLWAALKRPFEIEPGKVHPQFDIVSETYEILSVAKAQTTLRYWNWSLSSAFSPRAMKGVPEGEEVANENAEYSTAQRTANLVFGN